LYLATYRAYDAWAMRWLNRDPIEEEGGLNLYGYVEGNPLSHVDPTGLFKVHGMWCGPNWTGGRTEPYKEGKPANYYSRATDYTDAACQRHDKCFATCRALHKCDKKSRAVCMTKCNDD